MAQLPYRGNLSSKVFPFLSSQFGRSVINSGMDQAVIGSTAGEASGGDSNIPQAYYMHNVIPTAQGYKSVGYTDVLPPAGAMFDYVVPIRDPDMLRGWLGVTSSGYVYLYEAGDRTWTHVSPQVAGWKGGNISVAYANGHTYICFANFNVYRVSVANKELAPVNLIGLITNKIVSITSSANYLVVTDGVKVYWSSTVSPEDFVPSLTTGAGSGNPSDVEGLIIALTPLGNGFAIYTAVNCVIASYSQQARFPWIFRKADNSKGIADVQHVTYSGDNGTNYAWTSAGLQRISNTGAVTIMAEVTDFLTGQEFEDYDDLTDRLISSYTDDPFKVKLSFIAARYLIISYGVTSLTHALVYDTVLKRWGKLKLEHAACFEVALNSDTDVLTNKSASAKKTVGFVLSSGTVIICNFDNNAEAKNSVLMVGKFQIIRSRNTTLDKVIVECVDTAASNFETLLSTTLDGKTVYTQLKLNSNAVAPKLREYPSRVTGLNHTLIFKGKFNLNSFELYMHVNGRR
jgi:hypothetical protein